MIGRSVMLIALAVPLSVAAALAADPAAPGPAAPQKQRMICRGNERTLGSHIRSTRRCRTEEQWQREDEAKAPPISLQVTEGQNDGHPPAMPR